MNEYLHTCAHCIHGFAPCPIHPDRWPTATPLTCASFVRDAETNDTGNAA